MYLSVLIQTPVAEETAIEVQKAGELHTSDYDISPIRHADLVDLPSFAAEPNLGARRQVHVERAKGRGQHEPLDPMRSVRQVEDRSCGKIHSVERLRSAERATDEAAVEDLDLRPLRAGALVLTVVLGMEWTIPLGGYAQPNQEPAAASAQAASMSNQELPPMQEAEIIEERKPFYKKWWFWAIVGVVLVGGGAAAAMGGGSEAPGPSGTVTITGPPPR